MLPARSEIKADLYEFKMLIEEETIANSNLSKGFGTTYFRSDTRTIFSLFRQAHPVIPVRTRPESNRLNA